MKKILKTFFTVSKQESIVVILGLTLGRVIGVTTLLRLPGHGGLGITQFHCDVILPQQEALGLYNRPFVRGSGTGPVREEAQGFSHLFSNVLPASISPALFSFCSD